MKCIGKYSKLISVLLLTVVMATGCGITDQLGTKNVVEIAGSFLKTLVNKAM